MEKLSDYDYSLPLDLIAQTPLEDRAASRLLWLHRNAGSVDHCQFRDSLEILQPGDLLVLNDTRVSALRLFGNKETGGKVEALLLEQTKDGEYVALTKPAKSLRPGTTVRFGQGLSARVIEDLLEGHKRLQFLETTDLEQKLASCGRIPLPPYIHEQLDDAERYQTVYGRQAGSAAAPTAGLHFTPEILAELQGRGIEIAWVTLHVGIDTFRPVQTDDLDEHRMHGELCEVPPETARLVENCRGRIVAVGTTTVRTLESLASAPRKVSPGRMRSTLFIRPGFRFQIVDGMFTNFHLPKTTMLLMISALAGRDSVLKAYEEAVRSNYRFLSFGDSMLIL